MQAKYVVSKAKARPSLTVQLGCLQLSACTIRSPAFGQLAEGFPRRFELIRQLPLCLCRHRYDRRGWSKDDERIAAGRQVCFHVQEHEFGPGDETLQSYGTWDRLVVDSMLTRIERKYSCSTHQARLPVQRSDTCWRFRYSRSRENAEPFEGFRGQGQQEAGIGTETPFLCSMT